LPDSVHHKRTAGIVVAQTPNVATSTRGLRLNPFNNLPHLNPSVLTRSSRRGRLPGRFSSRKSRL